MDHEHDFIVTHAFSFVLMDAALRPGSPRRKAVEQVTPGAGPGELDIMQENPALGYKK
jgi:hypothetical protein